MNMLTAKRWDRTNLLLTIGFVTAAVWLLASSLLVPPIIRHAYYGESLPRLNGLIHGQYVHPVTFYVHLWISLAMRLLAAYLTFLLLAVLMSSEAFFRRCVGEARPGTLGAIRMWTCTILLMTALYDDLGSIGLLPLDYHVDMGVMTVLHHLPIGYDRFLTSETDLRWFQRITEALLLLGAIGWRTRLVIPLCALCTLVMQGILREYSGFWHQNLVPVYVLTVLSFTPCGDGWSLDRLLRIARGQPVVDSEKATPLYGWARYACWVPIALTYASAGFSKLRISGIGWISARNMRGLLYEQTLYPRADNLSISMHLSSLPDYVFVFLAITAILSEALFITVLFSRTFRKIMPAFGMLMHVGIVFLQNIVFFDLTLLLFIFYDFDGARRRIAQSLKKRGPITVLYDGLCPLCRRTVQVLGSLDLFDRLEFTDFRTSDAGNLAAVYGSGATLAALEEEMFVSARGRGYRGVEAYRKLATALPALWPIAPLLFIPGAVTAARAVYRYVAANRQTLAHCDHRCATTASSEPQRWERTMPGDRRRLAVLCGTTVAAVIAAQSFFWMFKIEFYPFTSVQMFTGKPGTVVTYYKTLGHWESGRVSPFRLEDTIGVMSINSRYENLFDLCFGRTDDQVDLCKRTLWILGGAYNRKTPSPDKLTQLEIQRWKWDYGLNPRDPQYGQLDASFIGDVAERGRKTPDQSNMIGAVSLP
jgi:predicted DCC family thiol-disulfide oxidoreductase YuxK